jgi:hypothetical protein
MNAVIEVRPGARSGRRLLADLGEVEGRGGRVGEALPQSDGGEFEIAIRQMFEADDFGERLTPELREQEERLRAQTEHQQWKAGTG